MAIMAERALGVLEELMVDKAAPHGVRRQAASDLLDRAGYVAAKDGANPSITEVNVRVTHDITERARMILAEQQAKRLAAGPESTLIDITPDSVIEHDVP